MTPLPVSPCHQHPNHQGTSKGNGQPAPRLNRENWQLLKDEAALTARIKTEAESCNPDKALMDSLKAARRKVRDEMKGQPAP